MAIELATVFKPYTDEVFKAESKTALVTNQDFDWTGAHTVSVYKITTAVMNDYLRAIASEADVPISRFGDIRDLSATTEEMQLAKDRSFIFNVDKMDQDETANNVEAASALARQLREVVIPEVDTYVLNKIATGAPADNIKVAELTKANIYEKIMDAAQILDDAEVPDTERVLLIAPTAYALLKQAATFDNTDVGADVRLNGIVGYLDGAAVVKVPATRLPQNVGFILTHPACTVAPVKLEDYNVHVNTPLASGTIVTGRVVYDAFVLDNKKAGIVVHKTAADSADDDEGGADSEG